MDSKLPFLLLFIVLKSDAEWLDQLGRDRYRVMRAKQTERPFSGEHLRRSEPGVYRCAACDLPLFDAIQKYDVGNGWPNFKQPIDPKNVDYLEDWSLPFKRYEVLCSGCGSHLGHVFHDGPPPKYLRYCINSISLFFKKE